ncbi:MAG TPA: hypothetical protein VM345_07825 [Acidimicrobiales bacterium]|jgi:hypothetical protein|nr:hypothetical protein [Acidimicrobiales bacterium]
MSQTIERDVLEELAAVPRDQLSVRLDELDPQMVVDAVARRFAARLDRKQMGKSGIVIQEVCHTNDDAVSTYITWSKHGFDVSPTYVGTRRPTRMEWQRLSDAVDYELDRITLQGVALVERFSMAGTSEEIETIFNAENVGNRMGHVIRSIWSSRNMPERQREKALRGLDVGMLLLEQQQAMNEALRIFNLLPELDGRVIEFRIDEGDKTHVVQSIYTADGAREVPGETVERHALLHFLRPVDFAQWINGKTNVPAIAMEGHLKVDGDFHLLEILARLPEPFDPAERWGTF